MATVNDSVVSFSLNNKVLTSGAARFSRIFSSAALKTRRRDCFIKSSSTANQRQWQKSDINEIKDERNPLS